MTKQQSSFLVKIFKQIDWLLDPKPADAVHQRRRTKVAKDKPKDADRHQR